MSEKRFAEMRADCLKACAGQPEVHAGLARQHIVVTGGTGFLGTWIAETVAALNDEYGLGINLDLFARRPADWQHKYPHLASRVDIRVHAQDVRSNFSLPRTATYIVHAAGIPNNRVHASDPLRVWQTTVGGIESTLEAASQLDGLRRIVNVSSCFVDMASSKAGQLHHVYAEAKRAAEMAAAIYRSQFRLPLSTVRPYTLTGAYQELDRPWAINNFLRDVLTGSEVRLHGDGSARRSYLYGADAAWWTLAALVKGEDGEAYNLGGANPVSHNDLVRLIGEYTPARPKVVFNTSPNKRPAVDELFPDLTQTMQALGVKETLTLEQTVEKTYRWFANA